jgi:phospholipase/carboxylesterase
MTDLPIDHVHVDPDNPTDGPSPAVFVLHGRGADEEDLLPVARRLPDSLHVVSLRAPDRLMGGYTWYEILTPDGDLHSSQPHSEEFRRSLDLVAESVEAAVDAYDLDSDRLGLLGFSQGAITSLSLLLESPERYAWVVALHGYLAESHADTDPEGIEGNPVFVSAGTADQIIPASRAEAVADRLRELGADVTFETYRVGHEVGREELTAVAAFVETQVD